MLFELPSHSKVEISTIRQALVNARLAKQKSEAALLTVKKAVNDPDIEVMRTIAYLYKIEAKALRAHVRNALRFEEVKAGFEYLNYGVTHRGARLIEGRTFKRWAEYNRTFGYNLYGDTWNGD